MKTLLHTFAQGGEGMKQFFVNTWATILRVGTALIAVFRGAGQGMTVLAVMMIADYITGVLRAALGKSDKTSGGRLSASAGFRGLLKKSLMLLAVLLSALLDDYAGANGVLRTAVIWFYICNEGLSVLENLAGMGVPVPQRLRALLNAEKQKDAS